MFQTPDKACIQDSFNDEVIISAMLILLVIDTFYRLYFIWNNTLNFSEVNYLLNSNAHDF